MYRVLLVDDEKNDLDGICRNISWMDYGMEVSATASNGKQGLELARQIHPDLIVTDVSMPVMNGLEMVREYRKEDPNVTTVFMTCFEEFEFAKNAISLHAAAYVLKPISLEELNTHLRRISEQKMQEMNDKIQRKYLEKTVVKYRPQLRDEFYKDLLLGNLASQEELTERAKLLELPEKVGCFACMHLQIDNYNILTQEMSFRERYLLGEKLLYSVRELLKHADGYAAIRIDNRSTAIVRMTERPKSASVQEETVLAANYIREQLVGLIGMEVTICVSETVCDYKDLSVQYAAARNAVESGAFESGNCVFMTYETLRNGKELIYDYQELKDAVRHAVMGKNRQPLDTLLDQFYSVQSGIPGRETKALSCTIVSLAQACLLENDFNRDPAFPKLLKLMEEAALCETAMSMRSRVEQAISLAAECIGNAAQTRADLIVNDIDAYINANYAAIGSVAQIADHLNISTSYANAVYRKVRGVTIFERLVDQKMEQACRMLKKPYCRVNEIAAELGYTSPAYFTTVFKRRYHMTPREYRNSLGSGDEQ